MDVSPSSGGIIKIDQTDASSYPVTSTFTNGTSVRLEAMPAPGFHFSNWSGDLSGSANRTTIVIDCNKKITASFSQITRTLTIQVSGAGDSTPPPGIHSYIDGSVVKITAIPDDGWQFDSWTGDAAEPGTASIAATLDSDKTLTANFSQVKPPWWLIGGIIAGVIVIAAIIWFAAGRRTT